MTDSKGSKKKDLKPFDIQLLEHEFEHVRRFAHSLAVDGDSAEDLLQDVMEKAINHLDSKKPQRSVRAWLFTIAKNRHIDCLRRSKVGPDREGPTLDPERHGEENEEPLTLLLSDLEAAIEQMDDKLQRVAKKVVYEQANYRETATDLKIPIGTVRSRLARARIHLRSYLHAYQGK